MFASPPPDGLMQQTEPSASPAASAPPSGYENRLQNTTPRRNLPPFLTGHAPAFSFASARLHRSVRFMSKFVHIQAVPYEISDENHLKHHFILLFSYGRRSALPGGPPANSFPYTNRPSAQQAEGLSRIDRPLMCSGRQTASHRASCRIRLSPSAIRACPAR